MIVKRMVSDHGFITCYLPAQQRMVHRKATPILSECTENLSPHDSIIEKDEHSDHLKIENSCWAIARL